MFVPVKKDTKRQHTVGLASRIKLKFFCIQHWDGSFLYQLATSHLKSNNRQLYIGSNLIHTFPVNVHNIAIPHRGYLQSDKQELLLHKNYPIFHFVDIHFDMATVIETALLPFHLC